MANYYVWSGAGGAGTGADWANAYTNLTAAYAGKANGDVFYVAHDHAESTGAAVTLSPVSSWTGATGRTPTYCVNRAGTVPPVSADLRTTATVTVTGAFALTLTTSNGGEAYFYGITFTSGSGANSSTMSIGNAVQILKFEACALRLGGTTGGLFLCQSSGSQSILDLLNTTIQVANVAGGIVWRSGRLFWRNTASAITGATIPTTLLQNNSATPASALFDGVDLSAMGAGKTLVDSLGTAHNTQFIDCKLGASATVAATPAAAQTIDLVACDSGATNYRTERYRYEGTQTVETTIVRTGGASDGTTPIAWKLVTSANTHWFRPYQSFPISAWNDTTGSAKTVTVYGTWGGGAVPLNDEIWIEAEYLGSAATPQASFVNSGKADGLATGANTTADATSTWGGGTTKFKMTVTLTPQMKGPINVTVKTAKASSTFYIDPKLEIA